MKCAISSQLSRLRKQGTMLHFNLYIPKAGTVSQYLSTKYTSSSTLQEQLDKL